MKLDLPALPRDYRWVIEEYPLSDYPMVKLQKHNWRWKTIDKRIGYYFMPENLPADTMKYHVEFSARSLWQSYLKTNQLEVDRKQIVGIYSQYE